MDTSDINFDYAPELMARYIHFYKTGQDLNDPNSTKEDPPPKKKQKKKHIPPAVLETRRTIQLCCRDNNLPVALTTFHTALKELTRVEPQVLYQLLNLCEGSFVKNRGAVHVGTPKHSKSDKYHDDKNNDTQKNGEGVKEGEAKAEDKPKESTDNQTEKGKEDIATPAIPTKISLTQRLYHANQIHTLLTSLSIPPTDQAFTALIRLSSRVGDFETAEKYLDEAEGTQQCKCKLRMYSSLLRGYCGELPDEDAVGNSGSETNKAEVVVASENQYQHNNKYAKPTQEGLIKALKVWKRMYDNSGGPSTGHPNYHSAKKQQQQDDNANSNMNINTSGSTLFGEGISPKITLSECEYSALIKCATALHDVPVMERVLSDVADEILVPGLNTTKVILDWFQNDVVATAASAAAKSNARLDNEQAASSALAHVTLPPRQDPTLGSVSNSNGKGWKICRNCTIDSATGILPLSALDGNNSKQSTDIMDSKEEACKTGITKATLQYRLKPVELTERAWNAMRQMNSSIVLEGQVEGHVSQYQGGGKGKKRARGGGGGNGNKSNDGNNYSNRNVRKSKSNQDNNNHNHQQYNSHRHKSQWRINAWNEFESFLQNHPPYNIVIDGANVGYFEQNFVDAPKHIDYRQIDWLLRHLLEQRLKELPSSTNHNSNDDEQNRIILFLHERHFSPKLCPPWANKLIQQWDGNEAPYDRLTVYRTPAGMNDDWFWMHAALLNGGGDAQQTPDKDNGNIAQQQHQQQQQVLAITNDEMRDHHFQMLAEGSFLRWKERHQVKFDFGTWNRDLRRREVLLLYPNVYSRRIQRVVCDGDAGSGDVGVDGAGDDAFVIPMPKKGDEGRFADGLHVAEEGVPEEETYVVVQRVI